MPVWALHGDWLSCYQWSRTGQGGQRRGQRLQVEDVFCARSYSTRYDLWVRASEQAAEARRENASKFCLAASCQLGQRAVFSGQTYSLGTDFGPLVGQRICACLT